jgi:hypothetical protein
MTKLQIESTRAAYIKLCESKRASVNGSIYNSNKKVFEYLKEIKRHTLTYEEILSNISALRASRKNESVYDNLISNKNVSKVYCKDDRINVITKTLYSVNYIIGNIKIVTDFQSLEISNLSHCLVSDAFGTIHIPQMLNNELLFGDLISSITELMINKDICNLISLIINYIISGKINGEEIDTLSWWPKKKENLIFYNSRINKLNITRKIVNVR